MNSENNTVINTLKEYYKGQGQSRLGGKLSVNGRSKM